MFVKEPIIYLDLANILENTNSYQFEFTHWNFPVQYWKAAYKKQVFQIRLTGGEGEQ